jgi:hypothetical protein
VFAERHVEESCTERIGDVVEAGDGEVEEALEVVELAHTLGLGGEQDVVEEEEVPIGRLLPARGRQDHALLLQLPVGLNQALHHRVVKVRHRTRTHTHTPSHAHDVRVTSA